MSPISHPLLASARADTTPSPISKTTSAPTSPPNIQIDSWVPPATVPSAAVSKACSTPGKQGITSGTTIGLGMIPVTVFLCAMSVFSLFWWRKRRAHKANRYTRAPSVPDKHLSSFGGSIDSSRRASKVLQMSAFSTPIYDNRYVDESSLCEQTKITNQREKNYANAAISRLTNSGKPKADLDSPIDGTSPFRLKRGDTVKRCSLGTEISNLWPSPPPSAWVRAQLSFTERIDSPPPSPESPLLRPQRADANRSEGT